jgi:hypothetical protein
MNMLSSAEHLAFRRFAILQFVQDDRNKGLEMSCPFWFPS